MKEILLLQELGVPQADIDRLKSEFSISHDLVSETTNKENVEGIITIKTAVTAELLDLYPSLKFIAVAFTGYDAVDMSAAKARDIAVFNVPAYATDSTAELAIGLAISLLREIPKGNGLIHKNEWALKPGLELRDKTVAIIGTGKIGTRTAELFIAFGCKIIGWSRTANDDFTEMGGSYVDSIEEAFADADIVSIHLPLNDKTKNIIDEKTLSQMKDSAFLINVARGPIVNTEDLAASLSTGKIAGAAVDVFDSEPIEPNNLLLSAKNTILTPHVAYKTQEALVRRAQVTFQNIKSFINGSPQNLVD